MPELLLIVDSKNSAGSVGALLLVSPTYFGVCSNLEAIAAACHARGVPLIVDEAHGAHFGLHEDVPKSALQQGADIAVQSTHKARGNPSFLPIPGNHLWGWRPPFPTDVRHGRYLHIARWVHCDSTLEWNKRTAAG